MPPTKIGFVLLSNSQNPIPSTRIAVLNMLPFLRGAGFEPQIVFEPADGMEQPDLPDLTAKLVAESFRIIVFQKVHGPSAEQLAYRLSASGIKTVYSVCDLVNAGMASATDVTIAVTSYLRSLYPPSLQPKMHVVHDGVERPGAVKSIATSNRGSRRRPLRAVLVTSAQLDRLPVLGTPPEWLEVTIVGRYPPAHHLFQRARETRWALMRQESSAERAAYLRFLLDRRIRCVRWDPDRVYEALARADIGIIPIDAVPEHLPGAFPPSWKVKSENRLVLKMSMGLPVIATPIPAYEDVVEQGRNGFLAHSRQEWLDHLGILRDPLARQAIGAAARASVLERFSMQEQARQLIMVLRNLANVGATSS